MSASGVKAVCLNETSTNDWFKKSVYLHKPTKRQKLTVKSKILSVVRDHI